jgi:hypothetical protein
MSKTKKYLLAFLCAIGGLFFVGCASIIIIFVIDFKSSSENIIGTAYLFLYLLAIAYIFYITFRAYLTKPQVLSVVMIDDHGLVIKKSLTTTLVLSIIAGAIFAFTFALAVGLDKVIPIFSKGVTFALMNTALAVLVICLFFHFYPKFHDTSLVVKDVR